MTLANINLAAVRTIYNSNADNVSHELEQFAREHKAELSQEWGEETTVMHFPDGSRVVMCGSQCDAQ